MKRVVLIASIVSVIIVAIGSGVFFFIKYQSLQAKSKNDQVSRQTETGRYVEKISHFMLLPKNEEPVLATVSDPSKLKDQAFFEDAQNGDKVLVYVKKKTAILYRPKSNMIVAVAPFNANVNRKF